MLGNDGDSLDATGLVLHKICKYSLLIKAGKGLRILSFKEHYRDKICGRHKNVRVSEVVNVVCQVQATHTKCAQCMHGRDQSKSVICKWVG